uniref:Sepiapterin reductase n=1 Tax=Hydra vulgaris TaxID=6087 RepID=T2MGM6_HYDVU
MSVGKNLFIVTGASRGFGQAIAEVLSDTILKKSADDSKVILLARNYEGLKHTEAIIRKKIKLNITIDNLCCDLSKPEEVEAIIPKMLVSPVISFDNIYFFNNAGCIGDVSKSLIDYNNYPEIQNYFNTNVVSAILIISKVCNYYYNVKKYVIQISSLAAIKPLRYSGLYCCAKASMDMFMKSLNFDIPCIRTLNYAPGPMDTDMAKELLCNSGDNETKKIFENLYNDKKIIDPRDSAKKLITLLEQDKFLSGSHIDFYEI